MKLHLPCSRALFIYTKVMSNTKLKVWASDKWIKSLLGILGTVFPSRASVDERP